MTTTEASAKRVVEKFMYFLYTYYEFRSDNGLNKPVTNVHEVCNAMTDKHGRICRQIKHIERNDPKEDWPEDMITSATGYLAYLSILLDHYRIADSQIRSGMLQELMEGVKQHASK